jgi:hypothetical protein
MADRAMAMQRNAVDEGGRELTEFRAAEAFDALHEREDFKLVFDSSSPVFAVSPCAMDRES